LARNEAKLNELAQKIQSTTTGKQAPRVFVHKCDCSNIEQVKSVRETIVVKQQSLPTMILHCAGMGRWRFLHEMDYSEILQCFNAPAHAAILVTRAFLPDMLQRVAQEQLSATPARTQFVITGVQSPVAYAPWSGATAYAISRFAFRGFNEALRQDLAGSFASGSISVQEVVVGETSSQYFDNNPGSKERIPSISLILPVSTPHQIADGVLQIMKTGSNGIFFFPFMIAVAQYLNDWFRPVFSWLVTLTGHKLTLQAYLNANKQD